MYYNKFAGCALLALGLLKCSGAFMSPTNPLPSRFEFEEHILLKPKGKTFVVVSLEGCKKLQVLIVFKIKLLIKSNTPA